MWAEFEWENKVAVNTQLADLSDYLKALLKATNMRSLTPDKAMSGECGFMAANLYARSIFGEDALANVSLEKNMAKPEAPVTGIIKMDTYRFPKCWNFQSFFVFLIRSSHHSRDLSHDRARQKMYMCGTGAGRIIAT